jgi:hypothetical protein
MSLAFVSSSFSLSIRLVAISLWNFKEFEIFFNYSRSASNCFCLASCSETPRPWIFSSISEFSFSTSRFSVMMSLIYVIVMAFRPSRSLILLSAIEMSICTLLLSYLSYMVYSICFLRRFLSSSFLFSWSSLIS